MQLTIPILLGIALADSINPVSFGLIMELLARSKKSPVEMLQAGYRYFTSFMVSYLFIGLILMVLFSILGNLQPGFYSVLGAVIFILGLLELNRILEFNAAIKRFTSEPKDRIEKAVSLIGKEDGVSMILGIQTAVTELIYTGGFYMGLTALLTIHGNSNDSFVFLMLYNGIVALPLLIIIEAFKRGEKVDDFKLWKKDVRQAMMLGIASLETVIGIWLMFWWFV